MSARNRQKRSLKRLKRYYGQSLQIIQKSVGALNLVDGTRSETETAFTIKKAVILPAHEKSQFIYDIAYLAANKNFTQGGFFDEETLDVIIDGDDLPSNYEFSKLNSIVIAAKEYQCVDDKDYLQGVGYIIRLKYIKAYGNRS